MADPFGEAAKQLKLAGQSAPGGTTGQDPFGQASKELGAPSTSSIDLPGLEKILADPQFQQKSSIEKIGWLNSVYPDFKKLSPMQKADVIQGRMHEDFWRDVGEGALAGVTRTGQHLIRGIHGAGKLAGLDLFPESSAVSDEEAKSVTTPPPTTGGQVGYWGETLGEFAVPVPGLSALKVARAPGLLNLAARFGVGALREGVDVGLKTLAQTGDPEEAGKTAAVAGPVGAAAEVIVPGFATWLRARAESQYAKVFHPLGRAAKETAQENVPRVIREGYGAATGWSLHGLAAKFDEKVTTLGKAIADEYAALDSITRTRLQPIYTDFAKWVREEAFMKNGNIKDPALYAAALEKLHDAQAAFGKFARNAEPSEVWAYRKMLDKYVYKGNLTPDLSLNAASQVNEALGNVIRNQLNKQHPSVAALNDRFHLWKTAAELIQRNITNEFGKYHFMRHVTRGVFFGLLGEESTRRGGADLRESLGIGVAAGLTAAFSSTAWRSVSAVTKSKIADLLVSGQGREAATLAARAVGMAEQATGYFAKPEPTSRAAATSPAKQASIPDLLADASKRYNVPLELLHKVAQKETGGLKPEDRATAESPKGAIGVMQILPSTAADYGLTKEDLLDPAKNIDMSARYLRWILDRPYIAGDQKEALRAYNAGVGHVQRGEPDTKETREYVK